MNIAEDKRVKLVAFKLKGGASTRWEQVMTNRRRKGKEKIQTWHNVSIYEEAILAP